MNERITFKKKPQKLQIVQHFFGFQLARAAPVLLLRATGVSSTSHEACWPSRWRLHHVIPVYKRGSVYDPDNYRGVHLTSVVAKTV